MQKKSRIILIFPILFVLISLQTAFAYWNGEDRFPPREVVTIVEDSLQ